MRYCCVYEASFASSVVLGMYTSHHTFMHIFGMHAGGCALLMLPRTVFGDEPIYKACVIYAFDWTLEGFARGELLVVCVRVDHGDMPK